MATFNSLMKMRIFALIFGFSWMSISCTLAQVDTTIVMDSIAIYSSKLIYQENKSNHQQWNIIDDVDDRSAGVDQLLSSQSTAYIKSYGQGSLATSSVRGGSAAQTKVLWNGIQVGNPMLGVLDFSHIPTFLSDEVVLDLGGNSGHNGSGAIAGTIRLNNALNRKKGLKTRIGVSNGSFGQLSRHVQLGWANNHFTWDSRLISKSAKNDFSFTIPNTTISKVQMHAQFDQLGVANSISWNLGKKHRITFNNWYVDHYVEIPPTILQNRSLATQADQQNRNLISYQFIGKNTVVNLKGAFIKELIDFRDSLSGIYALSDFTQWVYDLGLQKEWNQQMTSYMSANLTSTEAFAEEYGQPISQNQFSWSVGHQLSLKKWEAKAVVRHEVQSDLSATIPSVTINYALTPVQELFILVEESYRLPTLNDRYWIPGGNLDLQPERGWGVEIGYNGSVKFPLGINSKILTSWYRRSIKDWILWSKLPDDSFWRPRNITEVESMGWDIRFENSFKLIGARHGINWNYNYNRSVNKKNIELPKIAAGQQLFYSPIHNLNCSYSIDVRKFNLLYRHIMKGRVEGFNSDVTAFDIGSLESKWKAYFGGIEMNVYLHIHNLWNSSYQIVESRVMPGRNYKMGLEFSF